VVVCFLIGKQKIACFLIGKQKISENYCVRENILRNILENVIAKDYSRECYIIRHDEYRFVYEKCAATQLRVNLTGAILFLFSVQQ
jgi:hypothetical protein